MSRTERAGDPPPREFPSPPVPCALCDRLTPRAYTFCYGCRRNVCEDCLSAGPEDVMGEHDVSAHVAPGTAKAQQFRDKLTSIQSLAIEILEGLQ